jgi:hypothetical protein
MTGFTWLLRAEWTKLRSVRRWLFALLAVAALSIGFSYFIASTSGADANRYPDFVTGPDGDPVRDEFHFAHRTLTGDGAMVARVVRQADSSERAGAGIMIKDGTRTGSRYAAVMVTPGAGVRLSADYTTDEGGGAGAAPTWLRLKRVGNQVTASSSADGVAWRDVGTVRVDLPATAEIGLFVNSPPTVSVERTAGSTSVGERGTSGTATFDNVTMEGAAPGVLVGEDVAMQDRPMDRGGGATVVAGAEYTLSGSGSIGPRQQDDDVVQISLIGVLFGVMALIAVSVLFVTAEYRRGMIRTTFAATGGRGRVLAAKAIVLAAVAFAIGLPVNVIAFLLAGPALRANGFAPPAFPVPSLTDASVLRALLGSAVLMALVAVFSLGVGAILRRSAGAIAGVVLLIIVPTILASVLPFTVAQWLMRLTPAGGFAVQRAKPPTDTLVEPFAMIGPWTGLTVAAFYAVGALVLGAWLFRKRDA